MVLSSWLRAVARVHPVHLMNAVWSPNSGRIGWNGLKNGNVGTHLCDICARFCFSRKTVGVLQL